MLDALKTYAKEHDIPIISDEGLDYVLALITKRRVKHVLEIGSAIGYSAIAMASLGVYVDTIERDHTMLEQAKKNIALYDASNHIHLIAADALTYKVPQRRYDLIFIDAAKSQYMRLFEKYQACLTDKGIIVCDNLYFHHLDVNIVTNRHTKGLLRRLETFRQFLINHQTFKTEFIALGDGLSVSQRI